MYLYLWVGGVDLLFVRRFVVSVGVLSVGVSFVWESYLQANVLLNLWSIFPFVPHKNTKREFNMLPSQAL